MGVTTRPYRVVEFRGYKIRDAQGTPGTRQATDLHIVDARGRTVKVYPAGHDRITYRRQLAERHCASLNGTLARVKVRPWKWTISCMICNRSWWKTGRAARR